MTSQDVDSTNEHLNTREITDVQKQMICELCHTPSELLYGRNVGMSRYTKGLQKTKDWWRVDHGKHPTCERRYDTFGAGETQEEAIKQAIDNNGRATN